MPFDRSHTDILWVCPGDESAGHGTYDDPFRSMSHALDCVRPGQTLVMKNGLYPGDLTIQVSGTIDHPITIVAEKHGGVRIPASCWYFYDVCDVVVRDLLFVDALQGAISAVGRCQRNRFSGLRFVDCGVGGGTSCTLFLGGAEGRCNLVEDCVFERSTPGPMPSAGSTDVVIGLMVSEGEAGSDSANKGYLFRRNHFVNYSYGIMVGAHDDSTGEYGHVVQHNTVDGCSCDGIVVKSGDSQVRGNAVRGCGRSGIAVVAGQGTVVEDNRVTACATGIMAAGSAHTVQNNCIERCTERAVWLLHPSLPGADPSRNLIVENNTCVDCGGSEPSAREPLPRAVGVTIDCGVSCVVRRNLLCGPGAPVVALRDTATSSAHFITDNRSADGCASADGCIEGPSSFVDHSKGDFTTNSGYGAAGWFTVAGAEPPETPAEDAAYRATAEVEGADLVDELITDVDREELARRALLLGGEGEE